MAGGKKKAEAAVKTHSIGEKPSTKAKRPVAKVRSASTKRTKS